MLIRRLLLLERFFTQEYSQFLVKNGLAARLEIADDDSQLSNILNKFLQVFLQAIKFFSHFNKCSFSNKYKWKSHYLKTFLCHIYTISLRSRTPRQTHNWNALRHCFSQSLRGRFCCHGNSQCHFVVNGFGIVCVDNVAQPHLIEAINTAWEMMIRCNLFFNRIKRLLS